ncbi:flagellar biosynthesis protein FlhB [Clostridium sp. 'deep sea']|uniref:flagellar biosynthesis protein FlhB n=1 Tax=Clostridium sp. 'deep sea' TaxID=2779445 RepID=UPI0018967417|nr:flagellar biosynthesis protein FlhB [Clostridium sp. 'deep sea']QOR35323.1 flagellar biosynthesis protein FlhB [Clostridium sp. 'deep sea']
MAGEKTEKATPKKRRDARKEGQVLKSKEINSSVTMIIALLAMVILWRYMFQHMLNFMVQIITTGYQDFGTDGFSSLQNLVVLAIKTIAVVAGPILFVVLISGVAANYFQVGFLFTPKAILPKLNRISIIGGFKRLFSMTTLQNLVKSLLKIGACMYVAYGAFKPLVQSTVNTMGYDIYESINYGVKNMTNIAIKLTIVMIFISIIDFLFQWFENEKKLRMSKQEIKDEYKNTEGNPEIKSRIRNIQMKMASARMMQQVPEADVVITNPTHYAIALKYDKKKHVAPVVVAKGADLIAKRIKEIAKDNKVEIVESKELARALFASAELGDQIPPEFFTAVAEILAYVYTLKKKKLF